MSLTDRVSFLSRSSQHPSLPLLSSSRTRATGSCEATTRQLTTRADDKGAVKRSRREQETRVHNTSEGRVETGDCDDRLTRVRFSLFFVFWKANSSFRTVFQTPAWDAVPSLYRGYSQTSEVIIRRESPVRKHVPVPRSGVLREDRSLRLERSDDARDSL